MGATKLLRITALPTLAALALASACSRADEGSHAASTPTAFANAASQAPQVITDIAHWQHPTKAVFAKYKVALRSVAVQDRYATFQVAFPFDPQTEPNAATLRALCLDLLKANGSWSYALVSSDDHIEIDVSWDKQARKISIDNHPI
jgi:hypothetical protein